MVGGPIPLNVNQSDTPAKPRIIFVLGMHRSGTSLTTNVLSELGVSLSEDLMPATHENARGYFESQTISFLQDRILASFGLAWDTPTSMRALPPGVVEVPVDHTSAQSDRGIRELRAAEASRLGLQRSSNDAPHADVA